MISTKTDHNFLWRKLFSFTGIFPVGAFLAEHFWANSYALVSIGKYDETSRGLQQIPWRVPVEVSFIWLPFIGWHVWIERFLTESKSNFAGVQHSLQNPYYLGFYVVGVLASSVHLGNGIWTFLCTWGLAATVRSQRSAAWLSAVVALVFSLVAVAIVLSIRFNWRPFEVYVQ